jgi:hypothetical protein
MAVASAVAAAGRSRYPAAKRHTLGFDARQRFIVVIPAKGFDFLDNILVGKILEQFCDKQQIEAVLEVIDGQLVLEALQCGRNCRIEFDRGIQGRDYLGQCF